MNPSDAKLLINDDDVVMMCGIQGGGYALSVNSPDGTVDVGKAALQKKIKRLAGVNDTSYKYSAKSRVGTLEIKLDKHLRFGSAELSRLTATIHSLLLASKKR